MTNLKLQENKTKRSCYTSPGTNLCAINIRDGNWPLFEHTPEKRSPISQEFCDSIKLETVVRARSRDTDETDAAAFVTPSPSRNEIYYANERVSLARDVKVGRIDYSGVFGTTRPRRPRFDTWRRCSPTAAASRMMGFTGSREPAPCERAERARLVLRKSARAPRRGSIVRARHRLCNNAADPLGVFARFRLSAVSRARSSGTGARAVGQREES